MTLFAIYVLNLMCAARKMYFVIIESGAGFYKIFILPSLFFYTRRVLQLNVFAC